MMKKKVSFKNKKKDLISSKIYKFKSLDESAKNVAINKYIEDHIEEDILNLTEWAKLKISHALNSHGYTVSISNIEINFGPELKHRDVTIKAENEEIDIRIHKDMKDVLLKIMELIHMLSLNRTAIGIVLSDSRNKYDIDGNIYHDNYREDDLSLGLILGIGDLFD